MNDDIVAFIREQADGVAPEVIAERFLRFKNPNKSLADAAVNAILCKDMRVHRVDGLWRGAAGGVLHLSGVNVSDIPWVSVYLLADTARKSILHISLWTPVPEAECICSVWLRDPAGLSDDDREQLCDPHDLPYTELSAAEAVERIARELADRVPVFFSQQHYSMFSLSAQNYGIGLDDYYLMNQLFRAMKEPECRPLTLDTAAGALIGSFRSAESAYRQGELFCRVTAELIGKMKSRGIENRGQLDALLYEEAGYDFTGREFSEKMIAELPVKAGVYGFTDKSGAYIYIGKAVNLRRRIESYFRFNSESPEKLGKLRAAAHGLTIHRCGSELEALIYEYRLIKKHKPALNNKQSISERKGSYKVLPDSVIILPHTQEGFCVSVWIRKDQKIKLRAFELTYCEEEEIVRELREYFYSGALPASFDDFPELEIVTRWVKRNRDHVSVITVGNMADAEEIVEAMKNC